MTRKFNLFLLALAVLLGGPYYWFLLDNSHGDAPARRIDIAELRRLAASIPGQVPSAVHMERPAFRRVPGNLMVAGSGIKRKLIGHMGFLLVVPNGKPVVIDSGISAEIAARMEVEYFDAASQGRIDRAMDAASLILVTHEHADHLGALVKRGGAALGSAAKLNAAQLPPAPLAGQLDWSAGPVPHLRGPRRVDHPQSPQSGRGGLHR